MELLLARPGRVRAGCRSRPATEGSVLPMSTTAAELREEVRRRYAEAARRVVEADAEGCGCGSGSCCAGGEGEQATFGAALYDAEQRGELPEAATLASLGC